MGLLKSETFSLEVNGKRKPHTFVLPALYPKRTPDISVTGRSQHSLSHVSPEAKILPYLVTF